MNLIHFIVLLLTSASVLAQGSMRSATVSAQNAGPPPPLIPTDSWVVLSQYLTPSTSIDTVRVFDSSVTDATRIDPLYSSAAITIHADFTNYARNTQSFFSKYSGHESHTTSGSGGDTGLNGLALCRHILVVCDHCTVGIQSGPANSTTTNVQYPGGNLLLSGNRRIWHFVDTSNNIVKTGGVVGYAPVSGNNTTLDTWFVLLSNALPETFTFPYVGTPDLYDASLTNNVKVPVIRMSPKGQKQPGGNVLLTNVFGVAEYPSCLTGSTYPQSVWDNTNSYYPFITWGRTAWLSQYHSIPSEYSHMQQFRTGLCVGDSGSPWYYTLGDKLVWATRIPDPDVDVETYTSQKTVMANFWPLMEFMHTNNGIAWVESDKPQLLKKSDFRWNQ